MGACAHVSRYSATFDRYSDRISKSAAFSAIASTRDHSVSTARHDARDPIHPPRRLALRLADLQRRGNGQPPPLHSARRLHDRTRRRPAAGHAPHHRRLRRARPALRRRLLRLQRKARPAARVQTPPYRAPRETAFPCARDNPPTRSHSYSLSRLPRVRGLRARAGSRAPSLSLPARRRS